MANQLASLDNCCNRASGRPRIPNHLCSIVSPIKQGFWMSELASHPNQRFTALILKGLQSGFRIGFEGSLSQLKSSSQNLISAMEHPDAVIKFIEAELAECRISQITAGELSATRGIHLSPLGAIRRPNRWRLIMDLSAPRGCSVNDGISKDSSTCHYASVDQPASQIYSWGKGTLMAKMDIKQAYRNIPIAPEDRHLLGFRWNQITYIDNTLPFGLRSAPFIFTAIADALMWIMEQKGVTWAIHYIDDFLTLGKPGTPKCQSNKGLMEATCAEAGLPIEPEKSQGPCTTLTFLGIEIDTQTQELRLPADKLQTLKEALTHWHGKRPAERGTSFIDRFTVSRSQSRPAAFLRRLSTQAKELDHFIRLNRDSRSDIMWWKFFVEAWNGSSLASSIINTPADFTIATDASGSWGCGAIWQTRWFQLEWSGLFTHAHISIKEMVPIVIATAIWGESWRGKAVQIQSDNTAVVAAVNNNSSRVTEIAHLLRCLAFISAHWECRLTATHLPGSQNCMVDAISRNNAQMLRILQPQAQRESDYIPPKLIRLLITDTPDWASQRWTELWNATFRKDWHRLLRESTRRGSEGTSASVGNSG